jgi:RNA polymerase sigma-70 factor, ECF subfamily
MKAACRQCRPNKDLACSNVSIRSNGMVPAICRYRRSSVLALPAISGIGLITLEICGYSGTHQLEQCVLCCRREESRMQSTNAVAKVVEFTEIQSGEVSSETFSSILSNGLPSLYRGAYRLLGNTADAEDALQDALLAAYAHLDQFRGQSKMSTWLRAIVHNSARMQLRKRLRHVHVPLDEPIGEADEESASQRLADHRPSPEDEFLNTELSTRLTHFQRQLTPTLRRTFQLRHIEGLSIHEAARILGVPLGTVKAQSARARKKLSQLMRRALRSQLRSLTAPPVRQASAKVSS